MKKIILFIAAICFLKTSYSQYGVQQNLGNNNTLIGLGNAYGGAIKGNLINSSYTDTTAANSLPIPFYVGAQIWSTSDSSLYVRQKTAFGSYWFKIAGSGGGSAGTFWPLGYRQFPVIYAAFPPKIGTGAAGGGSDFTIGTNGLDRLIFPNAGILNSTASTDSVLVRKANLELGVIAKSALVELTAWSLTGNAGTVAGTNFLGTTDNNPLRFRINNSKVGEISRLGTVLIPDGSLYSQRIYIGREAGLADSSEVNISTNIGIGAYALKNYASFSTATNIGIGYMSLYAYNGGGTSEGMIAIGNSALARATTSFRSVAVGGHALHNQTTGSRNNAFGTFAGEWHSTGNDNTYIGESSGRLSTIGSFNTTLGNSAGYSGTGAVRVITITNGGSGYTSATVTISAPDVTPFGFTPSLQATATATINAGIITSITITEMGKCYSSATVSIGGDGTGATATATVQAGSYNVSLGVASNYNNRTGIQNISIGWQSGYGDGTNVDDRRQIDSSNVYLGTFATARGANPATTAINKSTAIGYKAIVGQSNAIVLGATGADQPNVGIGTSTPTEILHVAGNIRFSGALMPNNTAGTSGQVLTSAGAGVVPTWTTPSAGITGSGTLNYLPKWTPNGTTLGNSQIFDNGTNIGIRTASPLQTLEINGGVKITGYGDTVLGPFGNSAIKIDRTLSIAYNGRGVQDFTQYTPTASGQAYAAFDAAPYVYIASNAPLNMEHIVAFQARPSYENPGTLDRMYGFYSGLQPKVGTITNTYDYYADNFFATGSPGTIGTHYGYYAADFSGASYKAATNYAFYSAGTTPSNFGGAVTIGGRTVLSVNGAVSAPGLTGTGTWFTGGSATTTKPYVLIEPTGTTSTAWSTLGTGIGVNAASGFTGNFVDAQLNGVSQFKVAAGGDMDTKGAFVWGNIGQGRLTYSGSDAYIEAKLASGKLFFRTNAGSVAMTMDASQNVGIGTSSPAATAILDITSTTKGFLPPRMTTTNRDAISAPATGLNVYENTVNANSVYDGTRWVYTPKVLNGSATLDFGNTVAGTATDLTITVTGVADGDVVSVGAPNGSVSATDNVTYWGWVSAANTVTVRFNNNNLVNAVNPASGTFRVTVFK